MIPQYAMDKNDVIKPLTTMTQPVKTMSSQSEDYQQMEHSTEGLLIGVSLIVLIFFTVGMTLKLIRGWAQRELDTIRAEEKT